MWPQLNDMYTLVKMKIIDVTKNGQNHQTRMQINYYPLATITLDQHKLIGNPGLL